MSELTEALSDIRRIYVAVLELLEFADTPDELAEALTVLEEVKSDYKMVREEVEKKFFTLMEDRPEIIAGGKFLRVANSQPRKTWNHTALKDLVIDRLSQLAINQETGEVDLTPREAVDRILEFAHIDYWRAKQLQTLDINPDRFCQLGDPKKTIQIEDY